MFFDDERLKFRYRAIFCAIFRKCSPIPATEIRMKAFFCAVFPKNSSIMATEIRMKSSFLRRLP